MYGRGGRLNVLNKPGGDTPGYPSARGQKVTLSKHGHIVGKRQCTEMAPQYTQYLFAEVSNLNLKKLVVRINTVEMREIAL